MQNLKTRDKIAFIALAVTFLIASVIAVAVISAETQKQGEHTIPEKEAIVTQNTVVKEAVTRCRDTKTGRFIKCP